MKKGKILTILTSLSLMVSNGSFSFVNAVSAPEVSVSSEEKISEELYEVMKVTDESELIPVGVKLQDIDASEIDRLVEERSDFKICDYKDIGTYNERILPQIIRNTEIEYGFEKAHIMPIRNPDDDKIAYTADIYYDATSVRGKILSDMKYADRVEYILSRVSDYDKEQIANESFGMSPITKKISDDIDLYLKVRRECVTEAYKRHNYNLLEDYISIEQINSNVGFAPYITANLNKEQIGEISKDVNVEELFFTPEIKPENELIDALDVVNVPEAQLAGTGYTGVGVKIGILEAGNESYNSSYCMLNGCQNLNHVYIGNIDNCVAGEHATAVTSTIKGKTYNNYKGIAQDSIIYQAGFSNGGDFADYIELLSSYGVSILNFSFGFDYMNDQYTYFDDVLDYAINNYGLTVNVASGNTGTYVLSPGKAYNAITVGNCNATGAIEYPMCASSGYLEANGLANKPEISAPGTYVFYPYIGYLTGTSLSAPIVTGVTALMLQCMPTLKLPTGSQNQYGGGTYYNTVKAILLLGANYNIISTTNNESKMSGSNSDLFRDKSGAGMVDAKKVIDLLLGDGYDLNIKNINMSSDGTSPNGMNYYCSFGAGDELRSVLCFSKIHNYDDNNMALTLRDSINTQIVYSDSLYNNVEIVEYQFVTSGNYLLSAEINIPANINSSETLPGTLAYYTIEDD